MKHQLSVYANQQLRVSEGTLLKQRDRKRDWDEFHRFGRLLFSHRWVFAKTMPDNPHHYTLRREWDDDEFVWAVNFLRANGYAAYFRKTRYIQIDVNEHFYWTMGCPIPGTILINRKQLVSDDSPPLGLVVHPTAYDAMADERWRTPEERAAEDRAEYRAVFDAIGTLAGKDVLDVGCGNGLTLDEMAVDPDRFVGIDPSVRMLYHLRRRYPEAATLQTALYDFVSPAANPDGKYDVVLALFGVGSYLTQEELRRIAQLLRPGGRAAVMFYREGYCPRLYDALGVTGVFTHWQGQFPDALARAGAREIREIDIGKHVLVIIDRAS